MSGGENLWTPLEMRTGRKEGSMGVLLQSWGGEQWILFGGAERKCEGLQLAFLLFWLERNVCSQNYSSEIFGSLAGR